MDKFFLKRILPAVTFDDAYRALQVAEAIVKGGLNVMEVPLRTKEAFLSIQMIRENMPSMYIGAGTILTIESLHQAKASGAQFGLSPGFNPKIVEAAREMNFPFVPGVMTPSEVEQAMERGCRILKLFPAEQVGGPAMLKALNGPFKHTGVKFIPMGGVSLSNMRSYLDQENVIAVGGSWLATKDMIAAGDYEAIRKNTAEAFQAAG